MTLQNMRKYELKTALAMHRFGLLSVQVSAKSGAPELSLDAEALSLDTAPSIASLKGRSASIRLSLKYDEHNKPVVRRIRSFTSNRIPHTMNFVELRRFVRGFDVKMVVGMRPTEYLFVGTDLGILEIRECVTHKRGGLVMCRVNTVDEPIDYPILKKGNAYTTAMREGIGRKGDGRTVNSMNTHNETKREDIRSAWEYEDLSSEDLQHSRNWSKWDHIHNKKNRKDSVVFRRLNLGRDNKKPF